MLHRQTMTHPPPTDFELAGLENAANPDPLPALVAKRANRLRVAGFVLLLLLMALLAFAVFLGITIGVTILVALVLPSGAGVFSVIAPVIGVVVASLCFGAASRFRKGTLKNRYGLLRRPPRDSF